MKGKQEKITTDIELSDMYMYETHKKKKRIMLWLKCRPTKKRLESSVPSSKRPRPSPAHTSVQHCR